MKTILLGFIFFILISCKGKHKENSNFEYIDLSLYNGWTDFYCCKILNNGTVYYFNKNIEKGERYVKSTLTLSDMDSIENQCNKILKLKIDTFYNNNCVDCGCYNLIIKTKTKKFKSLVYGLSNSTEKLAQMQELMKFIFKRIKLATSSIDSNARFESRTYQFYPPPPPPPLSENVKFTAPKK